MVNLSFTLRTSSGEEGMKNFEDVNASSTTAENSKEVTSSCEGEAI